MTIDLTKALEQDEAFGIGNKGEIQNVAFGLYAAEDLTASNGDVIRQTDSLRLCSAARTAWHFLPATCLLAVTM